MSDDVLRVIVDGLEPPTVLDLLSEHDPLREAFIKAVWESQPSNWSHLMMTYTVSVSDGDSARQVIDAVRAARRDALRQIVAAIRDVYKPGQTIHILKGRWMVQAVINGVVYIDSSLRFVEAANGDSQSEK